MKKYGSWLSGIGTLAGALSGYIYWREVGCLTGHCPIQSKGQTMSAWGGIMGFLLTDLVYQSAQFILKRYGNTSETTLQ